MDEKQPPTPDGGYIATSPPSSDVGSRDPTVQEASTQERASILYSATWTDYRTGFNKNFRSEVPLGPFEVTTENLDGLINDIANNEPAIEIITSIQGTVPIKIKDELTTGGQDPYAQAKFQDINITEVGLTSMIINNVELLREIRSVVKYFPAQSLTGDRVEIVEPYAVLVHHLAELEALLNRLKSRDGAKLTCNHLAALLQFLEKSMGPRLRSAKARLSKDVPTVTYDDLWYLYKPGDDIYLDRFDYGVLGARTACVLVSTEYGAPDNKPVDGLGTIGKSVQQVFRIHTWGSECNSTTASRHLFRCTLEEYKGEKEVKSLGSYPSRFQDSEDGGTFRQRLETRGEHYYKLVRTPPKQMWHDGSLYSKSMQQYRGPVIIDPVAAMSTAFKDLHPVPEAFNFLGGEITAQSSYSDIAGQSLDTFHWASYHNISVTDSPELPSRHHYFLLQPYLPGFTLHDKTWSYMNVENLSEFESEVTMDNVIIDERNRDIAQAICHANSHPWRIDYISNKGEGQVALLHGPPGVGKTYTVECIAQATNRPLIALTMGDLMEDEYQIEAKLVKWFSLAERWKAILLLDEADIFLERRATRDIQRNGIVSIFLRRMEYFRGLLFLTTNRVGQIDDAFLSRVTAVLQYDHLTDDVRKKIWEGFFRKLEKDGERKILNKDAEGKSLKKGSDEFHDQRKIEIDKYARKYVLNDEEVKKLKWNGREIRNALQTAISLASYKAVKDGKAKDVIEIEEDHFKAVVAMSSKFKTYMERITNKDESQRARARQERFDGPESRLTA